jgi:hypothetical protein
MIPEVNPNEGADCAPGCSRFAAAAAVGFSLRVAAPTLCRCAAEAWP